MADWFGEKSVANLIMNNHKPTHRYSAGDAPGTYAIKGVCAHIKQLRANPKLRSPFRFGGRMLAARKPVVALLVLCICVCTASADAPIVNRKSSIINSSAAVRAIIGEAANQGPRGMLAVAGAIRNRGTLRGVYGLHNPIVQSPSPLALAQARHAWSQSATNDITLGATHWENTKAFGKPYWAANMIVTTNIGSHTFYREKSRR